MENMEGEKSGFVESDDENENMKMVESESSLYDSEDEGDEDAEGNEIQLGPQCTLKEQFEKDKDDESLRKWKEQLLGNVDINNVGESLEPEVKILSLSIVSPDRSDIVLPVPENGKLEGRWFTLKEGCCYSLRFSFQVSHNIVAGLKYTNNVWKTGVKVDRLIAQKRCLERLVHSRNRTRMRCLRTLHLLVILQEARTLLKPSLSMMTTSATWKSAIRLTSERIGLPLMVAE